MGDRTKKIIEDSMFGGNGYNTKFTGDDYSDYDELLPIHGNGGFLKDYQSVGKGKTNVYQDGSPGKKVDMSDFAVVQQREDFVPSRLKTLLRRIYASDDSDSAVNRYGDFSRMYFGVPLQDGFLYKSRYTPTVATNKNAVYYAVKDPAFIHDLIELYNHPGAFEKPHTGVVHGYDTKGAKQFPWQGEYVSFDLAREINAGHKVKLGRTPHNLGPGALGDFTIGRGKDDSGEYLSYYDLWDVDPRRSYKAEQRGFAKPYELYDRIYGTFDADGTFHPNGEIPAAVVSAKASGGKIHIKPENRGKFTALKKRTGHSASWFKEHGTPAQKKMAVFALNASKWKHADGGPIESNYTQGYLYPAPIIQTPVPIVESLPKEETYENKWDRISNARYKMALDSLVRSGESRAIADRLARFLAAQSALEAGWVDSVKDNNYAGYLSNGKKMSFDNAGSFWDYHISNMDSKWPGWRNAKSLQEYFDIVNNTALGLDTKEKFDKYNKEHRDAPVYIYAPDWDNENYLRKLSNIYNKYISKYVKPVYSVGGLIDKYGVDAVRNILKKRV